MIASWPGCTKLKKHHTFRWRTEKRERHVDRPVAANRVEIPGQVQSTGLEPRLALAARVLSFTDEPLGNQIPE